MAARLDIALNQAGLKLPEDGQIAVFRADAGVDYTALPVERTLMVNSDHVQFDRLNALGFRVAELAEGDYAAALVQITRSKAETLALIANALEVTAVGGVVIVDGAKTSGIESVLKQCKARLPIGGVVAKSHGKLFWMIRPQVLPEDVVNLQNALALTTNKDGFLTAAGMFSPAHVDHGSALLAAHFDGRIKGRVADLGAGWGWLAVQALSAGDIGAIDLFEAEKTALNAAAANISDPRAHIHWQDVRSLKSATPYDHVICNPPFHQGRAAEPAIGVDFIRKAAEILKPNGMLWLVANRQLPYEAALDQNFSHWKYLEKTSAFKAILASKPRSPSARTKWAGGTKHR
ncbi:MAG: class I SAM-dependent methyltransferase [Alphaproteobacteria bacterium]|nr:class I SAM-dependent methyltransferase [Alphaproteobacteria bacterium]